MVMKLRSMEMGCILENNRLELLQVQHVRQFLKRTLHYVRISVSDSEIGNEVEVGKLDGHHKRLPAKVVRFPFYDPEKTRVRM